MIETEDKKATDHTKRKGTQIPTDEHRLKRSKICENLCSSVSYSKEAEHVPNLLQAYVLDLLPPAEKQQVALQIGADPEMLVQAQRERQVGQLVKQTVHQAGVVENGRLAQYMPAIPQQTRPFWASFAPRQLAMVAMMLVLLLSGWQWLSSEQSALWQSPPTVLAVTATTTNTPTATQTHMVPTETAVANPLAPPAVITPAPPPTPVAAAALSTN